MSNCLAGPGGTHPDLSHLTAEERLIIQGVLARQRAEEQKERDLLKCVSHFSFYTSRFDFSDLCKPSR